MDQKLLDALNNLGVALDNIAQALSDGSSSDNKSDVTSALVDGNFIEQIREINVSVKNIEKDTKEILKNQQTILNISKQKEDEKKSGVLSESSDPKKESQLKKGVGTIILIAAAVLAIGMAFKLVGDVDFLSVISLGIGIIMVAAAFEKVGKLNLSLKQAAIISTTMVIMSLAITMSSWVLSLVTPLSFSKIATAILIGVGFSLIVPAVVKLIDAFSKLSIPQIIKSVVAFPLILPSIALGIAMSSWVLNMITPISFSQAITAILISGVFLVISGGIGKLLHAFGGNSIGSMIKAVVFLPLILPSIALGIALSSWALKLISPITFSQAITGILIAGLFTVVAFGMNKILSAMDKADVEDVLMLPLILPAMALAITVSSWVLSTVVPISFSQFLTSLAISVLFIALSFSLKRILKGVDKVSMGDVVKIPLLFTTMSIAIALSSHILATAKPLDFMFMLKVGVMGAIISIIAMLLIPTIKSMKKFDWKDIPKLPVFFTLMATAITVSSWILEKAANIPFKKSLEILTFGGVMAVLSFALGKVMQKLGKASIKDIAMGGVAILIIAGAISLASHIIAAGNYSKFPDMKWVTAVGLSLLGFGAVAVGLGLLVTSTAGLGALAIVSGGLMILSIAGTITASSHILAKGNYKGGPSVSWAQAIALTFGAFLPIYKMMMVGGILKMFGVGGVSTKDFSGAIKSISTSIVDAASILNRGKFTGGPTKEWAKGVSIALDAFSPIYKMLMLNGVMKIFGGGGVGPKDFNKAIKTISEGIVYSASIFNLNKVAFKGGPSKEWAQGVGTAIGAFSPVYSILMKQKWLGGPGIKTFVDAIKTISHGIISAAYIFASNKSKFTEGMYPSVNWGKGVGAALGAFAPVFKSLSGTWMESGDQTIANMKKGVIYLSYAIVKVARIFEHSGVKWTSYPKKEWSSGIGTVVKSFTKLVDNVENSQYNFMSAKKMNGIIYNIVSTAKLFSKNKSAFDTQINPDFIKSISSNVHYYMKLSKELDKANGGVKGMLKDAVFGDSVSHVASGMIKLAGAYDRLAKSLKNFSGSIQGIDANKLNSFRKLTGNIAVLSALDSKMFDNMLKVLESKAGVFGNLLKEQAPKIETSVKTKGGKNVQQKTQEKSNAQTEKSLKEMVSLLKIVVKNIDGLNDYINKSRDSEEIGGNPKTN